MHGLGNPLSVWEYALKTTGNAGWTGNRHNHDLQTNLTIVVDGETVVLADGESKSGSISVVVTRISEFMDDTDTTKIGDVTTIYTMTPNYGLDVSVSIEMVGVDEVTDGYRAMLPFDYFMDTGNYAGWPIYVRLSLGAGAISHDALETDALFGFKNNGYYAVVCILPDLVPDCFFLDNGDVDNNKIYCPIDQTGDSVSFSQRYMVRHGNTNGLRRK